MVEDDDGALGWIWREREREREEGVRARRFQERATKREKKSSLSPFASATILSHSPLSFFILGKTPNARSRRPPLQNLRRAFVHRALKGLKGLPKSWPATKAQNVRWTQGKINAVRKSLQSNRGMQQQRSRRCLVSMGEERSVQGLLRAKEAETGGGGVFEDDFVVGEVVPAVAAAFSLGQNDPRRGIRDGLGDHRWGRPKCDVALR